MARKLRESSAMRFVVAVLAGSVLPAVTAAMPAVSAAAPAAHRAARTASSQGAGPSHGALLRLEQRAMALRQAQAPGSITGSVLGPDGLPLAAACVTALGARGSVTTTATPGGKFVLGGLIPGSYELDYRDCAVPGRYLQAARHVQVAPQQIRAVPAMMLRPAGPAAAQINHASWRQLLANASAANRSGRITGKVTGNGKPLRGICVRAQRVGQDVSYGTVSRSDGAYGLRVRAGIYFVVFAPVGLCHNGDWLQQTYRGVNYPDLNFGNLVRVSRGRTTRHINAALRLGAVITGRVTARSGRRLGGICVSSSPFSLQLGVSEYATATAADGRYRLEAVYPGSYSLQFTTGCKSRANYAPTSTRRSIRVRFGQRVSGVDAVMRPGAIVTGVIRLGSDRGPGLAGICAEASNSLGFISVTGVSRAHGRYLLNSLGTGKYQLFFTAACKHGGNYVSTAAYAHLREGKVTGGVNAVMQPGATIKGVATDTRGMRLGGLCMNLYGPPSASGITGISLPGTRRNGSYVIDRLPAGSYQLGFATGCGNSGNYAPYWYDNQDNDGLASNIKLATGASMTINPRMQTGGEISGTVTDSRGRPVNGECVQLIGETQEAGGGGLPNLATSYRGRYHLNALPPGEYLVNFTGGCGTASYVDQWFPAKPDGGAADLVSVVAGQTTGVDAVLHGGGAIAGRVRTPSGRPAAYLCVSAYSADSPYAPPGTDLNLVGQGSTDGRGRYRISDLAAGQYDLFFNECGYPSRYANQWYPGQSAQATAKPILVRAGKTTAGVNARIAVGGKVTGRITNSSGKPVSYACAFAYNSTALSFVFNPTAQDGRYTLPGLGSGSYTVELGPCDQTVNLITVLRHVKVVAPHATTGVNATLRPGGSATGTVTAASAGVPLTNACVSFISPNPSNPGGFGFTDQNGKYLIAGIEPGKYTVNFDDRGCEIFGLPPSLAPQWFDNQPTQAIANLVTITVGHTVTGISAALQNEGAIAGTAVTGGNRPVGGVCVVAWPITKGSAPVVAISKPTGYALIDLLPGRYKVQFSSGCGATGYRAEWWQNASSRQAATVINVTAAHTVTGIDATLTR